MQGYEAQNKSTRWKLEPTCRSNRYPLRFCAVTQQEQATETRVSVDIFWKITTGPDPAETDTDHTSKSDMSEWGNGTGQILARPCGARIPLTNFVSKIFKWSIWPYMGALWARSVPKTRFWVIDDRFWSISDAIGMFFWKNNSARKAEFLGAPFPQFFLTAQPFFYPSWGGSPPPPHFDVWHRPNFKKQIKGPLWTTLFHTTTPVKQFLSESRKNFGAKNGCPINPTTPYKRITR